jgi:DegV family protein with EDD domain
VSVALVTDSTCDLPADVLATMGATVVPLYILFGEESFKQDVDIDTDAFFAKQRSAAKAPKTSQPTPTDFKAAYQGLIVKGHDQIVSLHISSDMSGTVRSAVAAKEELASEGAKVDIRVIDSRNVSLGLGLLVIEAGKLVKAGRSLDEIEGELNKLIPRAKVIFYVGTLEYLHKGGRIGLAKALLGALLSLKLILQVKDGLVQPMSKARKKAKLYRIMSETLKKESGGPADPTKVFAAHGDSPEEYEAMLAELPEDMTAKFIRGRVGGVVGCHSGPDVAGMAYFAV